MNALRVVEDSIRRSILSRRCLTLRTTVKTYVVHNGGKDQEFISSVKSPTGVTDEVVVDPPIPAYVDKQGETADTMRARLIYQSRKRGTLENGLLLSTFASQYLSSFTSEQLLRYDRLINKPSNDWDIYYWMVGTREPPAEFNNDVMLLLKEHAKNKNNESRICQPDLKA